MHAGCSCCLREARGVTERLTVPDSTEPYNVYDHDVAASKNYAQKILKLKDFFLYGCKTNLSIANNFSLVKLKIFEL